MNAVAEEVVILLPQNNTIVDRNIIFEGTGITGATVVMTADAAEFARVDVLETGFWRIDFELLSNGKKNIVATQTDLQGNVSTYAITINVTTREVTIDTPHENDTVLSHVLVSGEGDAGAVVEAFINGKSTGSTTIGWRPFALPVGQLPDGNHRIGVQQRAINGEVSSAIVNVTCKADRPLNIRYPEEGDVLTSDVFKIDAQANATLVATENDEIIAEGESDIYGNWEFIYNPTSLGEKTVTITQNLDGTTQSRSVTFHVIRGHIKVSIDDPYPGSDVSPGAGFGGHGDHFANITLRDGDEVIGEGVVDQSSPIGDSVWNVVPNKKLSPGKKLITATQVTYDGLQSSASISLNVVEKLPVKFNYPRDGQTTASNFSASGTGTVGAHVLLTDNSSPIGNARVGAFHNWWINVKDVPAGAKKWTAIYTYEDGTTSKATVVFNVEPQIPFIIEYPEEGSTVHQLDPEFAGTGQPDASVTYRLELDIPVEIAKVDCNGNWKGRSGKAFQYGKNSITLFQDNALEATIVTRTFYITPP